MERGSQGCRSKASPWQNPMISTHSGSRRGSWNCKRLGRTWMSSVNRLPHLPGVGRYAATSVMAVTMHRIKKDMKMKQPTKKAGPPLASVCPEPTKRPVPMVPPSAIIWACLFAQKLDARCISEWREEVPTVILSRVVSFHTACQRSLLPAVQR